MEDCRAPVVGMAWEFIKTGVGNILSAGGLTTFEEDKAEAIRLLLLAKEHDKLFIDSRYHIALYKKKELNQQGHEILFDFMYYIEDFWNKGCYTRTNDLF